MRAFIYTFPLLFMPTVEAGGLRGQSLPPAMNKTDVETLLMGELSALFRGGAAQEHINGLETELAEMYKSVPKEADGSLSHPVVRYMLHRFFTAKHGWYIRGLEPGNASALQEKFGNKSLQNLQEWVPNYLQKFLEELQDGRGIRLRELSVLAATLEDLIHKESSQRLEMTYKALELPFTATLDEEQLKEALEIYMMIYMLGGNFTLTGHKAVLRAHRVFVKRVKDWEQVQQWMHDIQVEVSPMGENRSLDFAHAAKAVEEVGRRYGTYNDAECGNLKSEILKIESTKAGRVRLAEFYKKGREGVFEFNEKIEYLRALGAIDESDPKDPHVLIPNYVMSRPNCLRASNFYVVCCRNECEDLTAQLERKFEADHAKPEEILDLVATMSTKTVEAPRKLSDNLVKRLNSIANNNRGKVPLHGKLFAQWMHHAFPRECAVPHSEGAVSPMTADEWMQATGHASAKKTDEELQVIVGADSCLLPVGEKARAHHDNPENALPWDEAEELLGNGSTSWLPKEAQEDVITLTATEPAKSQPRSLFCGMAPIAAVAGIAAFAWKLTPQKKAVSDLPC